LIRWVKRLFKRSYTMDFRCGKCNNIIVLRSDVPLVKEEVHCFGGKTHSGMTIIETKGEKNG